MGKKPNVARLNGANSPGGGVYERPGSHVIWAANAPWTDEVSLVIEVPHSLRARSGLLTRRDIAEDQGKDLIFWWNRRGGITYWQPVSRIKCFTWILKYSKQNCWKVHYSETKCFRFYNGFTKIICTNLLQPATIIFTNHREPIGVQLICNFFSVYHK